MKRTLKRKAAWGILAASACSVLSGGTVAAAKDAENLDQYGLQETIVTADRNALANGRVETIGDSGLLGKKKVMDAPFNEVTLGQQSFKDYAEPGQGLTRVLTLDPSVRSSSSTLYNDINIRGFNASGHFYYVNGIPGLLCQENIPTIFAENVTVMAGPGTGTGNTTLKENAGGTVNITTKKGQNKSNNNVKLQFSGRGLWEESVDIGRRFATNKRYGVRITANNIAGNTAVRGEKLYQQNIYVNLDQHTKSSESNVFMGYNHTRQKAGQFGVNFADNVTSMPAAPDGSTNLKKDWSYNEYDNWLLGINHEQKLSEHASVFLNAGWHHENWYGYVDGTPQILNNVGNYSISFSNYPLETYNRYVGVGIKGDFKLGSVQNQYIVSFDRMTQENYLSKNSAFSAGIQGNLYTGITSETYNGNPSEKPKHSADTALNGWHVLDTVSLASDKLLLTLGLHGHYVTQDSFNTTTGAHKSSVHSDAVCPTFGLTYKLLPSFSIYANHTESFGAGQFVSDTKYANAGEVLDPAKTKQNEIGIKWQHAGVLHTMSTFEIKQANYIDVQTGSNLYLTRDGEQKNQGFEYMVSGTVAPKWDAVGGFMYLDAKQEKTLQGVFDGKAVNGSANWSGVLGLVYKPNEQVNVLARANYLGDATIYTSTKAASYHQLTAPSHWTFDLGINWKTTWNHTPVTLQAMCYNVTDKKYWDTRMSSTSGGAIIGSPRTFMLSASFDL